MRVITTPKEQQEATVSTAILADVREALGKTKTKTTNDARSTVQVGLGYLNIRKEMESRQLPIKEWLLSNQTFEKLGELMAESAGKILGLYDELTNWLSQDN